MGNSKNLIGSFSSSLDLRVTRDKPLVLFEKKKKYFMLKTTHGKAAGAEAPSSLNPARSEAWCRVGSLPSRAAVGGQQEQLQVS